MTPTPTPAPRPWHPAGTALAAAALLLALAAAAQDNPPASEPAAPPAVAQAPDGATQGAATATEPAVTPAEAQALAAAAERAKADPAGAAADLRAALNPASSAALPFTAAAYALQAGRNDEAIDDLEEALRRLPTFHRARLNLAKMLLRRNQHALAAGHLRELLRQPGQDPAELWRLLAFALLADGHPAAAEAACCQALVWNPDDAEILEVLARSLVDQGRPEDAGPLARQQLRRQPDDRRWWQVAIHAALAADDRREATVLLESCRRLGHADAALLATLADLYLDQGLDQAAAETYAAIDPAALDPERLLRATEALLARQQPDAARKLLNTLDATAAALTPAQTAVARRLAGHAALLSGDPEALPILDEALRLDPLDGKALALVAEAMGAMGRRQQSTSQQVLDGQSLLETAEMKRGHDPASAAEFLRRAATREGFELRALAALTQLAIDQHRYHEALQHLQKILTLTSEPAWRFFHDQVLEACRQVPLTPAAP
ncbi:MAG: tetratricopeptide repeat protein [Lentisphaerae bacterium]|nr:tetratricopeptide repeat protein [Lentisphaerota bacterium]